MNERIYQGFVDELEKVGGVDSEIKRMTNTIYNSFLDELEKTSGILGRKLRGKLYGSHRELTWDGLHWYDKHGNRVSKKDVIREQNKKRKTK